MPSREEDARGRCYGSARHRALDGGTRACGSACLAARAASSATRSTRALACARSRPRRRSPPCSAARRSSDDGLRELDFGELEGGRYDEIAASEPDLYRAWMTTPTKVRFPGGESFADLKARAVAALERIRRRTRTRSSSRTAACSAPASPRGSRCRTRRSSGSTSATAASRSSTGSMTSRSYDC